jgi:hypothetical protein
MFQNETSIRCLNFTDKFSQHKLRLQHKLVPSAITTPIFFSQPVSDIIYISTFHVSQYLMRGTNLQYFTGGGGGGGGGIRLD